MTTRKIEKIYVPDTPIASLADICKVVNEIIKKQNELVDAVNELMGNKHPTSTPQAKRKNNDK